MRKVLTFFILVSLALGIIGWPELGFKVLAAPPAQSIGVFTSPKAGSAVRGTVPIEGSASHAEFWKYEVHYGRGLNPTSWTLIGDVHLSPVINGRLELWNTALVPDGVYSLRLRVVRKDGNYDEFFLRDIRVANTTPTETATPAVSPTATMTPTPLPATPTVIIEQPKRDTPTIAPSATKPIPTTTPTPGPAAKISGQVLLNSFWSGAKVVLLGFGVLAALAIVRAILVAIYRLVKARLKKDEDEDY